VGGAVFGENWVVFKAPVKEPVIKIIMTFLNDSTSLFFGL
jgi:hypothetical protein